MKNKIERTKKYFRIGLTTFVVLSMVMFGLFLNLKGVRATYDPTPTPSPTLSPTPSPSPSPKPTPSPTPIPSPSPEVKIAPPFPRCIDQSGTGDRAHYNSGLHQIVGNGLLEGKDDVYSLSDGNVLQCFVPPLKDVCIQTNWWRTDQVIEGWYSVNGGQWNLGNYHYLAKNQNYNCQPQPTPSPTSTPVASSSATTIINNYQEQHQEQNNNQTVNITTGQVAGAKVPAKTPDTGVSVLGMLSMLGAGPTGFALTRFGRGRGITAKKEESLSEVASRLFGERNDA